MNENKLKWQTRDEIQSPTNPLQAMREILSFTSLDCSQDKMISCLYGIIVGWDDDSYKELKEKHNWSDENIEAQKEWHKSYNELWNLFFEKNKTNEPTGDTRT
ncbi:hypothetical protein [Empedobacter sp.]|uniref:hypothetical protein n=1 Tax=Empedobacter sp. TaxID=1927715 RepID=UPI0028970E3B|nr:hypothetical protein [Empedobacter sp.]